MDSFEFYEKVLFKRVKNWINYLPFKIFQYKKTKQYVKLQQFRKILSFIKVIKPVYLDLKNSVTVKNKIQIVRKDKKLIVQLLKNLIPWIKGPFFLYGIYINSEWRADLKWDRLIPYISSLKNKTILDVGCGNGYYMWRMLGEGAKLVIGIDPNELALLQFEMVKKLIGNANKVHLLPLRVEELPRSCSFDVVFSMGVIYHQRSPIDHLCYLKDQLVYGGELILESIVIDGDGDKCLFPKKYYANMKNVYFIPSDKMMKIWLNRVGFCDVQIISKTKTTIREQRETKWTRGKSLENFLNSNNDFFTIEGYPAPIRAIFIARKRRIRDCLK